MRFPLCLPLNWVLILLITHLSSCQRAAKSPQGAQYILFNGTISGVTEWASDAYPAGAPAECAGDRMGPHKEAYLLVGKNPPWDPNPFFFELYHLASDCSGGGGYCETDDDIYDLDFTSAAFECFKPALATSCYVPAIYLDLNKAKIKQSNIAGELGYSVEGDRNTWIGGTSINKMDSTSHCGWVNAAGRYQSWKWGGFKWNATTPINYRLEFTNTTSTLNLFTTMLNYQTNNTIGTLDLIFSGSRAANQTRNNVKLDTSEVSTPQFKFLNGSDIFFASVRGTWTAAATPIRTALTSNSVTRTSTVTKATTTSAKENGAVRRKDRRANISRVFVTVVVYFLNV